MPEIHWDSELYNKQHHFVSDYGADVLQWLSPKTDEQILDVGCGTGQLASQIAASGAQVLGIDASPEMIAAAKTAHPNLRFEVIDATKLPFEKNFDAIFSNATFHWIESQQALTKSLFKSLKEGGRLVCEFGGKGNVESITNALASAAEQLGLLNRVTTNFWYFPSISTYTSLLESEGFQVENVWLFERPTTLVGEQGMYEWMSQFAQHAFKDLTTSETENLKNLAVDILKPTHYLNNQWLTDYKRLRVKAWKKGER